MLFVSRTDSTLEYGSGWADLGDSAKMTTTSGSQLTFSFTGKACSSGRVRLIINFFYARNVRQLVWLRTD